MPKLVSDLSGSSRLRAIFGGQGTAEKNGIHSDTVSIKRDTAGYWVGIRHWWAMIRVGSSDSAGALVGGYGDVDFGGTRLVAFAHHLDEGILIDREIQPLVEAFFLTDRGGNSPVIVVARIDQGVVR